MVNLVAGTHSLYVTIVGDGVLHVMTSWLDLDNDLVTPGTNAVVLSGAGTTEVVATPGDGTRDIRTVHIRNVDASEAALVTIQLSDGVASFDLFEAYLPPKHGVCMFGESGWKVFDDSGRVSTITSNENVVPSGSGITREVLASDITNNNASADTIQDVTGLSFLVNIGELYWFRFVVHYTAAATTTGSRWSINGPGSPTTLRYRSQYSLTTTTNTINEGMAAYDLPAASNASSAATDSNIAIVEGFIEPSSSGTLVLRFASEVSSSAIIAKEGSFVEWARVV